MNSVVVITRECDPTADFVISELNQRNVRVFRFDLSDFPLSMIQSTYLTRNGRDGYLQLSHRYIDLRDVQSIWYRKPTDFRLSEEMSTTERSWAAAEARVGFGGTLTSLDVRWMNHPHKDVSAEQRPLQLSIAANCGLSVPDTIVTNSPEDARRFCSQHREHGVVYKSLTGPPHTENDRTVSLYASSIGEQDITSTIKMTSHLLQERIPCSYHVRIVFVAGKMYAAKMESPSRESSVDWRRYQQDVHYSEIDIPYNVRQGLVQVMEKLGLTYSSSDWIVTPEGEWVFIGDLNPNGQWAWLLPIREKVTQAIANYLSWSES